MRRTKEILRLRFESGLGLRQIARSLSISVGTVHDYLQRAEEAGVKWPLPEGFDDSRLAAALFRQPPESRIAWAIRTRSGRNWVSIMYDNFFPKTSSRKI